MIHEYAGVVTELEDRMCPHCDAAMEPWLAPPETGWGIIVVCPNDKCSHYCGSDQDIIGKRKDSRLGCRYAENPDTNYEPFNLLAVCR
ncbi:MAG: hypothetical protein ACNI27_11650 [Desulfovibrio sp.]